jgi:UDPglucose 6-dehydrogenase
VAFGKKINMAKPINIAVFGLWHLGCVTAASLAQEDFTVCGIDTDNTTIENLQKGKPPIFEPGLTELIEQGLMAGNLTFTTDFDTALASANVVWVAFDTPVDEEDRADVAFLEQQLDLIFPHITENTLFIMSSQVPVGFTATLQAKYSEKKLVFAYIPENLRLGNALKSFRAEDRFVVGLDDPTARPLLEVLLTPFCPNLEWMSIKSAEMTKHALNSFLAVSVALINEIARICEQTGADAKEVERGLKSEARVGRKAYLSPGGPFAGGTLARDVRFLTELGAHYQTGTPLLEGVLASNEIHKNWVQNILEEQLANLSDQAQVTILGITYKQGTDTLRRSEAVNLGLWLVEKGVKVTFHDPALSKLPAELEAKFKLTQDLAVALQSADVLVLATGWQIYRDQITPEFLVGKMPRPILIDQNRYLAAQLGYDKRIKYLVVGKPRN